MFAPAMTSVLFAILLFSSAGAFSGPKASKDKGHRVNLGDGLHMSNATHAFKPRLGNHSRHLEGEHAIAWLVLRLIVRELGFDECRINMLVLTQDAGEISRKCSQALVWGLLRRLYVPVLRKRTVPVNHLPGG